MGAQRIEPHPTVEAIGFRKCPRDGKKGDFEKTGLGVFGDYHRDCKAPTVIGSAWDRRPGQAGP